MPLFASTTDSSKKPVMLGALAASVIAAGATLFSGFGGSAFAGVSSLYADLAPETIAQATETGRQDRLVAVSAEQACRGQAWGKETMACLVSIARESGHDFVRPARIVVAGPELQPQTPNVF